jgi:hypothetical protein
MDSSRNPHPVFVPVYTSSGEIDGSGSSAQRGMMSGFGCVLTAVMNSPGPRLRWIEVFIFRVLFGGSCPVFCTIPFLHG